MNREAPGSRQAGSLRATARLLVFVGLAGLCAGPVVAQPEAGAATEPDSGFIEVVDVAVANIDVWVTDKDGNPVEGLEKDDFVVKRDGEPVEITNFYAVWDSRPVGVNAGAVPLPADEPRTREEVGRRLSSQMQQEIAPEHRLWLIVYIDNYNVDPLERNRVLPALSAFLRRHVRRGNQAMLVSSTRRANVVQPFTDNGSELEMALREMVDDVGHAVVRRREMVDALRSIDDAGGMSTALNYATLFAEEQMNNVQYTTRALEELVESLGGLVGRKALIHVSSGMPMLAGEEMFHVVAEKFDSSEPYSYIPRYDTSREFERVDRLANAQRVVFYTVDASGLRNLQFGSAEYAGFVDMDIRRTLDSVVTESLQAPLRLMAIETGGQAIVNQNNIGPALERAARDFRSFYSLGISAGGLSQERYHRIEVELAERRKGLQVRHRSGYRAKTLDTRMRESLRSALLYKQGVNAGEIEVSWGRASERDGGDYLLPLQLRIPLEHVVLLPLRDGKHEARLRLYVGAVGPDGRSSFIDSLPFGVRLANEHVEAAKKESLLHSHQLQVDRGQKRVGVAVVDLIGGTTSVVTRTMQVGPPVAD